MVVFDIGIVTMAEAARTVMEPVFQLGANLPTQNPIFSGLVDFSQLLLIFDDLILFFLLFRLYFNWVFWPCNLFLFLSICFVRKKENKYLNSTFL